jgi:F420-dependent oxidoreductase-like protein
MKLATGIAYGGDPHRAAAEARDLEAAGVDMVSVAEVYTFDAVSLLGYLAAVTERIELASSILPVYSRTPTLLGMTAAGLDAVSGGRFILGLGTSGPQVIEGWHGVPYTKPIAATRDTIEICRKVWRRETVVHEGEVFTLPLPADRGTGLGKPLKLINHPVRPSIPIYLAALGHRNVQLAAELAEGWIPAFFHPDKAAEVWGDDLAAGTARRSPDLGPLEIVAGGTVAICDEHRARQLRDAGRPRTALYVGGMGARGRNFYHDVFVRYGYGDAARRIQDLYLAGHKKEAEAAVPADFLEAVTLAGDEGRVRERIEAFRAAGVTRLTIHPEGEDRLALVEKIRSWAA